MKFKGLVLTDTATYPKEADSPALQERIKSQLAIRMADALINSGLLVYEFNPGATEMHAKLTLDLDKYVINAIKQIIDEAESNAKVIPIYGKSSSYHPSSFSPYSTSSFDSGKVLPKTLQHPWETFVQEQKSRL